jgi:hypothetical protein
MKAINYSVRRLIEDVATGRLVLPDFQRSFVWRPDDVKELLVSILGRYYIGSILYMDEPEESSPFALKLVEGVDTIFPNTRIDTIVKILLDGQQRTSSLFYAIYRPTIPLAGRKQPTLFFVNLQEMLRENWDSAIAACNITNKRMLNAINNDHRYVSLNDFLNVGPLLDKVAQTLLKPEGGRIISVVNDFMNYELQAIELPRGTPLERVVETFERINRSGVPLSITDLLVARLYQKKIRLRNLIEDAEQTFTVFRDIPSEYVLRTICLMRGKEVRKQDILKLEAKTFLDDPDCPFHASAMTVW